MQGETIGKVIEILKRETKRFESPIVTQVSRKKDPFVVLISCLLSLRTKDAVTAKASERLFSLAETPQGMLSLKRKQIEQAIYPVGFYKTKARSIKGICKTLIEKYNGNVPDSIEELLKLKGVGRKTANIVITLAYKRHGIAVDTHVHRISNRLGLVKTKTPEQTEFALREMLPKKYWIIYNDLLVTWGQNVCVPVSPFCSRCAIKTYCKRQGVVRSR